MQIQIIITSTCPPEHVEQQIEGSVRLKYDDGSEKVTRAGEVFYRNPGHTAIEEEDLKLMDFSPERS